MQIKIYEEFPTKKSLKKLKLIDFPFELILASPNLKKFKELEKISKNLNKNITAIAYWPTLRLEEGYWISPWSKKSALKRIIQELKNEKVYLKWDTESPFFLRKRLYFTEFFNFFSNISLIKKFLKNYKGRIITAERPNILPEFIAEIFALSFNPKIYNNEKVKMIYTSLGKYYGKLGHFFFKIWYKRTAKKLAKKYKDKFVIGIGCTSSGILEKGILKRKEPLITLQEFKRDVEIAKKYNVQKIAIFRLAGLNKDHIKTLKSFL